jgi:hypothetical protein
MPSKFKRNNAIVWSLMNKGILRGNTESGYTIQDADQETVKKIIEKVINMSNKEFASENRKFPDARIKYDDMQKSDIDYGDAYYVVKRHALHYGLRFNFNYKGEQKFLKWLIEKYPTDEDLYDLHQSHLGDDYDDFYDDSDSEDDDNGYTINPIRSMTHPIRLNNSLVSYRTTNIILQNSDVQHWMGSFNNNFENIFYML